MIKRLYFVLCLSFFFACNSSSPTKPALVFQTDFGVKDGAVSAMKGVAHGVDPQLQLFDLTHEIQAYDTWEAAYRLYQTAQYWPRGTVFVSVIDPGVGTERKSVVMLSKSGHYFVTPDNGTLTLVSKSLGIEAIREINEEINRRQSSGQSYTFHGRDVYAYTGARLAAGTISFEEVGKLLPAEVVKLEYQEAVLEKDSIKGNIPVLDVQYGNVWSNINDTLFAKLGIKKGDMLEVGISESGRTVYRGAVQYVNTFGVVPKNHVLGYMNSLMNFSLALNEANFADSFKVKSGKDWTISVRKCCLIPFLNR